MVNIWCHVIIILKICMGIHPQWGQCVQNKCNDWLPSLKVTLCLLTTELLSLAQLQKCTNSQAHAKCVIEHCSGLYQQQCDDFKVFRTRLLSAHEDQTWVPKICLWWVWQCSFPKLSSVAVFFAQIIQCGSVLCPNYPGSLETGIQSWDQQCGHSFANTRVGGRLIIT